MEVYLDVLILENIVMNYLILWTSGKLSKIRTTNLRLFIGALLGALYAAVLIIKPNVRVYYTAMAKIFLSIIMIAVSFPTSKFIVFFKALVMFYISTFIFAGAAFALIYLNNSGAFIKNGMIYFYWQSRWVTIFLSIITTLIILKVFQELIQYKIAREDLLTNLKIKFGNKEINIVALIDTGNSLHDPLSNMPVVIVELSAVKSILPLEISNIFECSVEENLKLITEQLYASKWVTRFRLIPFNSLGKENGILIGFRPDYIEIGDADTEKVGISDVIIGIYNQTLSKEENYKALLSPDLI